MRRFQLIDLTEPPPLASWAPLVVGFGVALGAAYLANPAPRPPALTLGGAFVVAARYLLTVVCAGALAAWFTHQALPVQRLDRAAGFGFAGVTAGLAPVAVFLAEKSFWAVLAAVLLGASAARLVRYCVRRLHDGEDPGDDSGLAAWRLPEASSAPRLLRPLTVALSAQLGVISACLGYWRVAAAVLFVGSAVLTWLRNGGGGWWSRTREERAKRLVLLLAVLIAVTTGGLAPYLQVPPPGDGESLTAEQPTILAAIQSWLRRVLNPSAQTDAAENDVVLWGALERGTTSLLQSVFSEPESEPDETGADTESEPRTLSAVGAGDGFAGMILRPESQRHVTIVPPLPVLEAGLFGGSEPDRMSVPFFGVYWFYRQKDGGLPPDSVTSQGDPALIGFSSNDFSPMAMEAHQNFGRLIDYRCCRGVQVAIRNGDRRPGTVEVELDLVNTRVPERPSVTLGPVPVMSSLRGFRDPRPPGREVLEFWFPSGVQLREFDEVTVRFLLRAPRADRSARIAIERFVFLH